MPPDCVVKFQPIDIAKLLLWQPMRASDVYERNIKARAALTYEPLCTTQCECAMQAQGRNVARPERMQIRSELLELSAADHSGG